MLAVHTPPAPPGGHLPAETGAWVRLGGAVNGWARWAADDGAALFEPQAAAGAELAAAGGGWRVPFSGPYGELPREATLLWPEAEGEAETEAAQSTEAKLARC